jgi:hypothetical protein
VAARYAKGEAANGTAPATGLRDCSSIEGLVPEGAWEFKSSPRHHVLRVPQSHLPQKLAILHMFINLVLDRLNS